MKSFFRFLILLGVSTAFAFGADKQPDILLIMPDQMRGDCLSTLKHPAVRTPTLDKLAAEGTLFSRAYTTCPSCIPARYSLLTGQFPSTSGVVGFKGKPITSPTLPELLVKAGYTTALIGRNMHQVPADAHYGFEEEVKGSTYVNDDDYDHFLMKEAPDSGGIRAVMNRIGVTPNGWEASPWPLKEELHPTVWTVGQARKFLKSTPSDKPVFVATSFFSPHPPLFPPKRFFDYYLKQNLPPAAHGDWVKWDALTTKGDKAGHRVLLEGETLRKTQAGYFGLTEFLDEQIAPLIADFRARSEKAGRPWLIVFTTDHGEMLGDNGFYRKCEPYEGSANIPFIVAGSRDLKLKPGLVSTNLVCLEDVMPTCLEVAGAKAASGIDGLSVIATCRGEAQWPRPILHFEHADCYSKAQAFQALTDGRYKYIWRPLDGSENLFDLKADPHEEHDLTLVKDAKEQVELWRNRMIAKLANRPEGFSDGNEAHCGAALSAVAATSEQVVRLNGEPIRRCLSQNKSPRYPA